MIFSPEAKELIFTLFFAIFTTAIASISIVYLKKAEEEIQEAVEEIIEEAHSFTPHEFFSLRTYHFDGMGVYAYSKARIKGIYIIANQTKKKVYIGNSEQIIDVVGSHFEGNGDKSVYRDYRNNNRFVIKLIPIKGTGFSKLKEFEKYARKVYEKYYSPYNE